MHSDSTVRPPLACSLLLRVISLIVRKDSAASWFARREVNLHSLWVLAMPGEFAAEPSAFWPGCAAKG
jgi:hypothetical protein